jgi:hypothetical protein
MIVDDRFWGGIYTFEKAGDEFPVHVHNEGDNHITMLMYGGIRCMGHPRYEGVEAYAKPGGTILNWKAGEPHGFVALVDGTTIANVLKVGR